MSFYNKYHKKDNNKQCLEELIYNEKNKLITRYDIETLINKYLNVKINIKNINLYIDALTDVSYTKKYYVYDKNNMFLDEKIKNKVKKNIAYINVSLNSIVKPQNILNLREESYQRLEFLGDQYVKAILTDYLYHKYPNSNEGFLTTLRIRIENTKHFFNIAKELDIGKWILISKYKESLNYRKKAELLEDCFEALMGAIVQDLGFVILKQFIFKLIEKTTDFEDLVKFNDNYKDHLLRLYHKLQWPDPVYIEHHENKLHAIMIPDIDGKIISYSKSINKKDAQQNAAKDALIKYNVINHIGEYIDDMDIVAERLKLNNYYKNIKEVYISDDDILEKCNDYIKKNAPNNEKQIAKIKETKKNNKIANNTCNKDLTQTKTIQQSTNRDYSDCEDDFKTLKDNKNITKSKRIEQYNNSNYYDSDEDDKSLEIKQTVKNNKDKTALSVLNTKSKEAKQRLFYNNFNLENSNDKVLKNKKIVGDSDSEENFKPKKRKNKKKTYASDSD